MGRSQGWSEAQPLVECLQNSYSPNGAQAVFIFWYRSFFGSVYEMKRDLGIGSGHGQGFLRPYRGYGVCGSTYGTRGFAALHPWLHAFARVAGRRGRTIARRGGRQIAQKSGERQGLPAGATELSMRFSVHVLYLSTFPI